MKIRSKWKRRRKRWLDSRIKKLVSKRKKRKHLQKEHKICIIPPKYFSLTDNTEETMSFIMTLIEKIDKGVNGSHFFIDSSKVEVVTVDALIYLLATIQNNHAFNVRKIICTGNYPKNKEARKIYLASGFNAYVRSRIKSLPRSNEKIEIKSGIQSDTDIAKQCCIFTRKTKIQTKSLYTVLIELMSNTFHHAYDNTFLIRKQWYIYAERREDYTHFIFIDTGRGIASTVRKNFPEKIRQIFGNFIKNVGNDAELIQSAFHGEFRTATKQGYRGNGLVTVKKIMSKAPFENFEVISGHGRYSVSDVIENYSKKIYGTLFTFDVR